jgi:hypothetical protein
VVEDVSDGEEVTLIDAVVVPDLPLCLVVDPTQGR